MDTNLWEQKSVYWGLSRLIEKIVLVCLKSNILKNSLSVKLQKGQIWCTQ